MVLDWGMSEKLQHSALGSQRQSVFLGEEIGHPREYSEATAREIDEEVAKILNNAYTRAVSTLSAEEDKLENLAEALLEKEVLDGQEVEQIVGNKNKTEEKAS
jgi:cell division protease FtsH